MFCVIGLEVCRSFQCRVYYSRAAFQRPLSSDCIWAAQLPPYRFRTSRSRSLKQALNNAIGRWLLAWSVGFSGFRMEIICEKLIMNTIESWGFAGFCLLECIGNYSICEGSRIIRPAILPNLWVHVTMWFGTWLGVIGGSFLSTGMLYPNFFTRAQVFLLECL